MTTFHVIDGGLNALEFDLQMTRRLFGNASTEPEFVSGSVIGFLIRDDADRKRTRRIAVLPRPKCLKNV